MSYFKGIAAIFFLVIFSGVSFASGQVIKRDTDNNGVIDQVAYVGKEGTIIRLELYSSEDVLKSVQHYENGHLLKVEKDTNGDRAFDIVDYFEADQRVRQEKFFPGGVLSQVIYFDESEKISEIRKDSDKDGIFDRHFFYAEGDLSSSTVDADGDGKINIWKTFQNNQIISETIDGNGDGLPEKEIFYNQQQEPEKSCHDLDADGYLETRRDYSGGMRIAEKKDLNQDNVFDLIIEYKSSVDFLEKQDANFDGITDIITRYEKGKRVECKKDTDFDGVMDRTDFFDDDENPLKIILDTNNDKVPDHWHHYNKGALECSESDRNHDAKPDLQIFYADGKKHRLTKDDDFNGFFEISQRFEEGEWAVIVELDSDENSHTDAVFFYTTEGLVRKDVDENNDDAVDFCEFYDRSGRVIKSKEAVDGSGYLNLTWYYDESQIPVRAEQDTNADGSPDIWYDYVDNRLAKVCEDTNHDSQPDVWEEYDAAEEIMQRSRDLNFDGVPDIKEDFTKADSVPETDSGD